MTDYVSSMRELVGRKRLILVGSGVFVYKDGMVLLQRRRDNGCWADHGGCVEIGEDVEETARRELFEETGLIAQELRLLGVFSGEDTLYTYPNGDEAFLVIVYWLCERFTGDLRPDSEEVAELRWFGIDHLPPDISPPVIRPLKAFVERVRQTQTDQRKD